MKSWIDQELDGCEFADERLGERFKTIARKLSEGIGESIPMACQDWSNTKAAYHFFSNPKVNEGNILEGHFQSTKTRVLASTGPILILHDTTEFSYTRENTEAIGITHKVSGRKKPDGRKQMHTICGILMHSSLAITAEGLPLGIGAIKLWTRKQFKGARALKKKINPTRIPIEEKESFRWLENLKNSTVLFNDPDRCIHIGDRESDIYELFSAAKNEKTHFVFRTGVDRLAGDGEHTIQDEMDEVKIKGLHRIEVRDKKGELSEAILEIKYRRIKILPPIGKQKKYSPLHLTVIHAKEHDVPRSREQIDWKLITDLSIQSCKDAIEKLDWYALRWRIEIFHKILKSGCKAEESKLRTAERLVNLIAVFCVLSWRVFWMTMINRSVPNAPPSIALTRLETKLVDQLISDKCKQSLKKKSLSNYLIKIARLGGYLARASDPPLGNVVMWRGLSRLTDIELGFMLGSKKCG